MTKCKRCGYKFSDHLFSPLVTTEGTFDVCPICALGIRNAMMGIDMPFTGEMASQLYDDALEEKSKQIKVGDKVEIIDARSDWKIKSGMTGKITTLLMNGVIVGLSPERFTTVKFEHLKRIK